MKFGIREVCDCRFTHLDGNLHFAIDTAKMSSLESSSTTVYAQGGKGFSRLAAWEGEKSVTFTVEDAILSKESLEALLGEKMDRNNNIRVKNTSFAGYYKIEAYTLVKNIDNGENVAAKITIHKAKLQSNINLSMSPTGDPSAFTFTFDAFATNVDGTEGVLYDFTLGVVDSNVNDSAKPATEVLIHKGDKIYTGTILSTVAQPSISISASAGTSITGTSISWTNNKDTDTTGPTLSTGEDLVSAATFESYSAGKAATINLVQGTRTVWYIV